MNTLKKVILASILGLAPLGAMAQKQHVDSTKQVEVSVSVNNKTIDNACDNNADVKTSHPQHNQQVQQKGTTFYYPFWYPGKDPNHNPSNIYEANVSNPSARTQPAKDEHTLADKCKDDKYQKKTTPSGNTGKGKTITKPSTQYNTSKQETITEVKVDVNVDLKGEAKTDYHKPEQKKECEPEYEWVYNDGPIERKTLNQNDSIFYRYGILFGSSNTKVPQFGAFTQLGREAFNRYDARLTLSRGRREGNYSFTTTEKLKHPTLSYEGVSNLDEEGTYKQEGLRGQLTIARYIGKNNNIAFEFGGDFNQFSETINGKETYETWFNGPKNQKIEYDWTERKVDTHNKTKLKVYPVAGISAHVGRIGVYARHTFGDASYSSNYAPVFDMGSTTFGMIWNLGPSKSDENYSRAAVHRNDALKDARMRKNYSYPVKVEKSSNDSHYNNHKQD